MDVSSPVAADVYELVHEPAGGARNVVRTGLVLLVNLLTMGSGPTNPGGGRYRVVERSTGREVGRISEWFGDDDAGRLISTDLAALSPERFVAKWL